MFPVVLTLSKEQQYIDGILYDLKWGTHFLSVKRWLLQSIIVYYYNISLVYYTQTLTLCSPYLELFQLGLNHLLGTHNVSVQTTYELKLSSSHFNCFLLMIKILKKKIIFKLAFVRYVGITCWAFSLLSMQLREAESLITMNIGATVRL
jgi:hypothetical protein